MRKIRHGIITPTEIANTARNTCFAARFAPFRSSLPIYWEQMIAAPVVSAAKICITRLLMESTSEMAEIAALPTLLTIMVSAIPIKEFKSCSRTIGNSKTKRS